MTNCETSMDSIIPASEVNLPAIPDQTLLDLDRITDALGVPRGVLASGDEIARAWDQLPRLLTQVPADLRNDLHVRMCVAVASGLFDSAISYAWNSAILELRNKVRSFGLHVIPQVIQRSFDEGELLDLKDSELLDLCLSLNLIVEDAYFFLNQCRAIRNSFSAAHPTIGEIDDAEFIAFFNRVVRYALSTTSNPRGVDTHALIDALKESRFTEEQRQVWLERLEGTHDAQREIIISMLHGIYCDPGSSEETRLNALDLCRSMAARFTPRSKSELINRHSDYVAQGQADRRAASLLFFEALELTGLLGDVERHALVSGASKKLISVHEGWDNFHNEPPFAERLLQISQQAAIPDSVKLEFVTAAVTCGSGNPWGVSRGAYSYYQNLVRGFSPREVSIMLDLPNGKGPFARELAGNPRIRAGYKALVGLIDSKTVPASHQRTFREWQS